MKFHIKIDNSIDKSLGYYSNIVGTFEFERDTIEQAEEVFEEFRQRFPSCAYQWLKLDATLPNFIHLKSFNGRQ